MIKMSDGTIESTGHNIKRIFKGSVLSIFITIFLLFIFSAILTYTSVSEATIPVVVLGITGISILIGSQISTVRIRKNGILNGSLIGIIYIFTIYLMSSLVTGNFRLNIFSCIMIAISCVTGAIGGVIGVNRR